MRPSATDPPKEIADGVWVIRDHRIWLVPNITIIAGTHSALVVDTGLGPANGEKVLALARRLVGSRKLFLTLTHFHPEHGYGAQIFQSDATIIYNRAQRDELVEKGEHFIELFRRTQSPAAASAMQGTKIVMPRFVYDGSSAELDLGDRKAGCSHLHKAMCPTRLWFAISTLTSVPDIGMSLRTVAPYRRLPSLFG